jgi:putative ABC transport system ATP-binding protein
LGKREKRGEQLMVHGTAAHRHGRKLLELRDVWKIYKMGDVSVEVLRGVSLTIRQGEFVAIAGPSGSGKSTLLQLVGCLDLPTKGKIVLDGDDISKMDESHLAQTRGRKIGFVFQQFNLMPAFDAKQNVELPMIFQGVSKENRGERAESLLKSVGLTARITHKPKEMSGGEQQRVAFARSLANNPEIILADEPTGNLDSKTGQEIMDLLINLHKKEYKTIIMVTHDMNLVRHADKIVRLKDGQIVKIEELNGRA